VDLGRGTATGEGEDTLVVEGALAVHGSDFDDVLVGSRHEDSLFGRKGDDLLRGLAGDDYLAADRDHRRSTTPGGDDRVYAGAGDDSIVLGNGDDLARGSDGRDGISHRSGRADLLGGPGRDSMESLLVFAGGQQIRGGEGRDELYLWAILDDRGRKVRAHGEVDLAGAHIRMVLGDRVRSSRLGGFETLQVPHGSWGVTGTWRDETIIGSQTDWSRLVVRAAGGDDRIFGTPGDDRIDGGRGTDRVEADLGRDVCISAERPRGCEVRR
jgi:Ca2+-binding RTX toxin-like protein